MAGDEPESPMPDIDWRAFTPDDSPKGLPDIVREQAHLATPDVRAGGPAFDFELPLYDFSSGRERATGELFKLSQVAANRPVALIFGSYT